MEFSELAAKRYSVRKFKNDEIEKEKLDMILKAGQVAPTAANKQPQRILVINDEQLLSKLKDCTKYVFNATLALLICYDNNVCWKRRYDDKDSGDIDASIIATHMMLQAYEIGIGSTWVMSFNPEKVRTAFNLPDNFVPSAILVMGYPADDASPNEFHNKRVSIEETVFYNNF